MQEQVARIVAALPEARGFALAGGAALIARGAVGRTTDDLDFFGAAEPDVERLHQALRAVLIGEGFGVEVISDSPGFVRIRVSSGEASTILDLGTDARLQPAESTELGDVLTLEELGADKMLALFSRAQARDFVDVAALSQHLGGLDRLCQLASMKDSGFSRDVLREMLGGFARLPRAEFDLDEDSYDDLAALVEKWIADLGS